MFLVLLGKPEPNQTPPSRTRKCSEKIRGGRGQETKTEKKEGKKRDSEAVEMAKED